MGLYTHNDLPIFRCIDFATASSVALLSLIQCNDEHGYPINDEHATFLTIVNRCKIKGVCII